MAVAWAGHAKSNYLALFDAIDKQAEYNEDALLKKFRKEAFVKQFSVAKKYLYEQILKSQRVYNSQYTVSGLVNAALENSEVLFSRGLYPLSFDELNDAMALAIKYDQPLKLLEVKARERAMYLEIAAKNWDEQIGQNLTETKAILNDYRMYLDLFDIYYRLMFFWRHERIIRTEEQRAEMDAVMQHPLLGQMPENAGFFTRQIYLTIHMIYCFISNNDEKSFEMMNAVLQMWDNNPAMKEAEPIKYLSAVNNYFNICFKLIRIDLIRSYLNNFDDSFVARNEAAKAIKFETFSNYRMILLYADNKFDEVVELLEATREGIKQHAALINPVRLLLLKFNSLILYWIQGQFSDAIDMANEILNEKQVDLRRDIQAATRIVYLILHYELNNAVMLESAIRSSKRYLKTREQYYEAEKVFFRHFFQLNQCAGKADKLQVFIAVKNELSELFEKNPLERNFLQTLNVVNWLDAKINETTLKEVLIAQALNGQNA